MSVDFKGLVVFVSAPPVISTRRGPLRFAIGIFAMVFGSKSQSAARALTSSESFGMRVLGWDGEREYVTHGSGAQMPRLIPIAGGLAPPRRLDLASRGRSVELRRGDTRDARRFRRSIWLRAHARRAGRR